MGLVDLETPHILKVAGLPVSLPRPLERPIVVTPAGMLQS